MKTSTLIAVSAIVFVAPALWTGHLAVAAIMAVGHALLWRTHILEVKINKLLDDKGIFVANYELDE